MKVGDWRLPLIFAAPVLLLAGVLYLALQPLPGATAANRGSGLTVIWGTTPLPTFVPTPYPTATPLPVFVPPPSCSTGVTAIRASASVSGGQLILKVTDQRGHPVVCAWFQPVRGQGQSFEFYGDTQGDGTLRFATRDLPARISLVEQVYFDPAETAVAYGR